MHERLRQDRQDRTDSTDNGPIAWANRFTNGRPKTVRPMLSDRCLLSVWQSCPVCDVGVLWPNGFNGDPAPPPPKGTASQFMAHICCGQMVEWIKMPLGMEVGLGPSDFVLDGDPAPSLKRGHRPTFFGPCLLWPNGWMDQDGTCRAGGPRSRPHCAR